MPNYGVLTLRLHYIYFSDHHTLSHVSFAAFFFFFFPQKIEFSYFTNDFPYFLFILTVSGVEAIFRGGRAFLEKRGDSETEKQ